MLIENEIDMRLGKTADILQAKNSGRNLISSYVCIKPQHKVGVKKMTKLQATLQWNFKIKTII
ncbi:CLUMA_CG015570, isoform A [Clunio marinus]|uniref:CLUMA_CG015570, isoform A n=1 Tax=Clunio marinus TaxID=568069 RepID=A0A1J1IPS2_9DIPT|nr:CLUMA_CG015570, isoform A [Clunio marinus]